jgi:hypothetical protein
MSLPMSRMLLMPATLAVVPRRHRSVAVRGRCGKHPPHTLVYGDEKVANRDIRVWHFVIENGY